MAQSASKICEICLRAPGKNFCSDCEQYFCDECKRQHVRAKISKDHHFQNASDVVFEMKLKCKEHNEEFTFLCLQCDEPVCGTCVTDRHSRHQMSKLKDSIAKLMQDCEEISRSNVDATGRNLAELEQIISKFDVDVETAIKAASDEGDRIKAMVDKQVNGLITTIKQTAAIEKEELVRTLSETKALKKAVGDMEQRLRELQLSRKDGTLLQSLKSLSVKIVHQKPLVRPEMPVISFRPGNSKIDKDTVGFISFRKELRRHTDSRRLKRDIVNYDCVICLEKVKDPKRLKCGHVFCNECISEQFKRNSPVCPVCGSIEGRIIGNQPQGTMTIYTKPESLEGYRDCGRIEIQYLFPSGKQGPEHESPGKYFDGKMKVAYLPNNQKGQLISKMLRVAFDRKLVFTIGDSLMTGKRGVVEWNGIHHKTNPTPFAPLGYPDPAHLDRVIEELRVKGVTEDDVKET